MKEWCIGISSKVLGEEDTHYYFNDYDECTKGQCIDSLLKMVKYAKDKYNIDFNNIYVFSDRENAFRVISFTKMSLEQLVDLISTTKYNCINWVNGVIKRKRAVIRTSTKKNRVNKEIYVIDLGNLGDFPEKLREEKYRTEVRKES